MNQSKIKFFILLLGFSIFFLACTENKQESSSISKEENLSPKQETPKAPVAIANTLGKKLYILCEACHSLEKGGDHKVGPNLHGIFGSKAGIKEGFKYSDALKTAGIIWNDDNMRLWLKNPTDFIPGANMAFVGIKNDKQMDALIAYIKEQTQ